MDDQKVKILGSNFECITSEIHPIWNPSEGRAFSGQHEIFWRAVIPPFSIGIYSLLPGNQFPSCPLAKLAKVEFFNAPETFVCPNAYVCDTGSEDAVSVSIQNKYFRVTADVSSGLMTQIQVTPLLIWLHLSFFFFLFFFYFFVAWLGLLF